MARSPEIVLQASAPRLGAEGDRGRPTIRPEALGSGAFRSAYGLKYAYLAGAMYKAIASRELVVALGRAGLMGYFGTGGLSFQEIETAVADIQRELPHGAAYGMNLLHDVEDASREARLVDLYLARDVRHVEAAAYMTVTRPLVKYRLSGMRRSPDGAIKARNNVLAKVSRAEVAARFMQPPPTDLVRSLVQEGQLSEHEAELGLQAPLAGEVCVEADSGGHTDQGVAYSLFPAMLAIRDAAQDRWRFDPPIVMGAAGGIGTPEAVAAAFLMGADFVMTGSVNQCSVEAGASEAMKELLQDMDVQDTAYAPAGDMFELGSRVQVLKKGVLFPGRANKLFDLYRRHPSWTDIDAGVRGEIESRYFGRSVEAVWREIETFYGQNRPRMLDRCSTDPKAKLALIMKWYFVHSTRQALAGGPERANYQIHTGPALGSFNRLVRGGPMSAWRQRRVAAIAELLMTGAAERIAERMLAWSALSAALEGPSGSPTEGSADRGRAA